MEHFNALSASETERLALLAEECSEVIQIVNKILRHGYESHNPYDPDKKTNRQLLEKELGHLKLAEVMMAKRGDLQQDNILDSMRAKNQNIGQWLHHQNTGE